MQPLILRSSLGLLCWMCPCISISTSPAPWWVLCIEKAGQSSASSAKDCGRYWHLLAQSCLSLLLKL